MQRQLEKSPISQIQPSQLRSKLPSFLFLVRYSWYLQSTVCKTPSKKQGQMQMNSKPAINNLKAYAMRLNFVFMRERQLLKNALCNHKTFQERHAPSLPSKISITFFPT